MASFIKGFGLKLQDLDGAVHYVPTDLIVSVVCSDEVCHITYKNIYSDALSERVRLWREYSKKVALCQTKSDPVKCSQSIPRDYENVPNSDSFRDRYVTRTVKFVSPYEPIWVKQQFY